eukprot:3630660-Prymnesium_polylepis.1
MRLGGRRDTARRRHAARVLMQSAAVTQWEGVAAPMAGAQPVRPTRPIWTLAAPSASAPAHEGSKRASGKRAAELSFD